MGSKFLPIHQETQTEQVVTQGKNPIFKSEKNNIITVHGNVKSCTKDKINNQTNLIVQRKGAYNDVIYRYLQKTYDQRRKLMIQNKYSIENDKAFNK